jgi:hypothetical protein
LELNSQRGAAAGPPGGSAEPLGQPNPGSYCAGPICSNGHLTIMAGLSSCAFARFPLNRGRERGEELLCSLSSLSLPLTHSCLVFHWILAQVWLQENSLSHFFCCKIVHTHGGTTFG